MTFIDAKLAAPPCRPNEPVSKPTGEQSGGFWRKARWFAAGVAVAGGVALFAYRTFDQTMDILTNGKDAIVWVISGAEQAKKREELLLAALEGYRVQLVTQHAILERLEQIPPCRALIEVAPKAARYQTCPAFHFRRNGQCMDARSLH